MARPGRWHVVPEQVEVYEVDFDELVVQVERQLVEELLHLERRNTFK
jgi:hypothetical protein